MAADETEMGCAAAILYAMVTMPATTVLRGWTLQTLWAWFVVPAFGLPSLSIPVAIGISLIVSFLTAQVSSFDLEKKSATWEKTILRTILSVLVCVFALAIGWFVHHFWM